MYLTVKQQLKHLSKNEFKILRELSHYAKNLTNEAIYNIRQQYFQSGKYLSYGENYKMLKASENYRALNSNMAQQILKETDGAFKSFFGLLKRAKAGNYSFKACRLPHYLPKDGYATLIIGFVRIDNGTLVLPYSNTFRKNHNPVCVKIPPNLTGKEIKEIRIIPKANARFFEIQYTYKAECIQRNLNNNNALALDLGVNNLVTAVSSAGKSFIIDGKKLKSINQWYNKRNSALQSIKDKQHFGKGTTHQQDRLAFSRNRKVNDYISKAARKIVNYCIEDDIGTLVAGYNNEFQKQSNIGKANNQNLVNIPFGKLLDKLAYLCELNGIRFIMQEESYTSQASFWDGDYIPVFDGIHHPEYSFSGKRKHRGEYVTSFGKSVNADINGALNILRKSNVVDLTVLYSRGNVDTPVRIRVA